MKINCPLKTESKVLIQISFISITLWIYFSLVYFFPYKIQYFLLFLFKSNSTILGCRKIKSTDRLIESHRSPS